MQLQLDQVNCGYGKRTVLADISFTVKSGEFFCLLGPNGVGKTTLFKTILRLLKIQSGRILLDGEDIGRWSHPDFAKRVGYVPQAHAAAFGFKVSDVVAMGRAAHLGLWRSPSKDDRKIAADAMDTLGIGYLKDSTYTEISGGERQLVLIARALAQKPDFLVLDEPTSSLDYGNQIRVLDYIEAMIPKTGLGVIMTTHSPNQVLRYGSRAAAIGCGEWFRIGKPAQVITPAYMRNTYGVDVQIVRPELEDGTQVAICVPLPGRDFGRG